MSYEYIFSDDDDVSEVIEGQAASKGSGEVSYGEELLPDDVNLAARQRIHTAKALTKKEKGQHRTGKKGKGAVRAQRKREKAGKTARRREKRQAKREAEKTENDAGKAAEPVL
jgi:hypothetical protein